MVAGGIPARHRVALCAADHRSSPPADADPLAGAANLRETRRTMNRLRTPPPPGFPTLLGNAALLNFAAMLGVAALLCVTALLGVAAPLAHGGSIHNWVDEDGVTHFSNVSRGRTEQNAGRIALTPAEHAAAAKSAIYKYRDADGVIHYTDARPQGEAYTVVQTYCPACDPNSKQDWRTVRLHRDAFNAEIAAAARRWQIDPALVRAVIHAESAFNPEAISRAGAQGLMQLMPATAGDYGVTDPFNVYQNIEAGTRHLAGLLERYRGDIRLATAAYNAGAGAVERHGGIPPFAETRVYVERVGILHQRYRGES